MTVLLQWDRTRMCLHGADIEVIGRHQVLSHGQLRLEKKIIGVSVSTPVCSVLYCLVTFGNIAPLHIAQLSYA